MDTSPARGSAVPPWTIPEFQQRLAGSIAARRAHDRGLIITAAALGAGPGVIAWLGLRMSPARLSFLVDAWLGAVAAFLLFILFTARHAKERRAIPCPVCGAALDEFSEEYEQLALTPGALATVACPICKATIAGRAV